MGGDPPNLSKKDDKGDGLRRHFRLYKHRHPEKTGVKREGKENTEEQVPLEKSWVRKNEENDSAGDKNKTARENLSIYGFQNWDQRDPDSLVKARGGGDGDEEGGGFHHPGFQKKAKSWGKLQNPIPSNCGSRPARRERGVGAVIGLHTDEFLGLAR